MLAVEFPLVTSCTTCKGDRQEVASALSRSIPALTLQKLRLGEVRAFTLGLPSDFRGGSQRSFGHGLGSSKLLAQQKR